MTNSKNLIVLNDSSVPIGGATVLALESAIGAAQSGWQVSYIAQANDNPDPRLAANRIQLIEIDGTRISGNAPAKSVFSGLWNAKSLRTLERRFQHQDLSNTVFHVHNWAHFLSPSIFKFLKQHQSRTVFSAHDFFLTCGNGGQFNFPKQQSCPLTCMSVKCLTTQCDKQSYARKAWRVTRHGLREKALPARGFNGKIALVHDKQSSYFENAGFNTDALITIRNPVLPLSTGQIRAEKNNSILFIGRIDVEKRAHYAAEAAAIANVKMVFAGDGPLKPVIERDFPNAEMKGFCSRKQLSALLKEARLLILPSLFESFGLVAVEALWSGVPVLISRNLPLADDIIEMNAGVYIDPNDTPSLVQTIKKLMGDDDAIKTMSRNGFENCKTIANTKAQWHEAHNELYEQLLSDNRREYQHIG